VELDVAVGGVYQLKVASMKQVWSRLGIGWDREGAFVPSVGVLG